MVVVVSVSSRRVFFRLFLPLVFTIQNHGLFQRFSNFFSLFFYEVLLHWIVIIVVPEKFLQLDFFSNQWSCLLFFAFTFVGFPASFPSTFAFAVRVVTCLVFVLFVANAFNFAFFLFVSRVIYTDHSAHDSSTTQVVHGQVAALLVFIFQEAESARLARFFVSDEIDVHGVAILAEDCQNVSFGKLERQAADVKVSCVAIVGVPGRVGRNAFVELGLIQSLNLPYRLHRACLLCLSARAGEAVQQSQSKFTREIDARTVWHVAVTSSCCLCLT